MIQQPKTIQLLTEQEFRKNRYGEELMSILREREDWIENGTLTIFTNVRFTFESPVMQIFNLMLADMKVKNIISIKIKLD